MYSLITHWPDQNPILHPCRRRRRSNHMAPPSLPRHRLKLTLLTMLLLLRLLGTMLLFLLNTLLLLLLHTLLLLLLLLVLITTRIHWHGFSPTAAGRTPLKK
jgi:hypothetical protein